MGRNLRRWAVLAAILGLLSACGGPPTPDPGRPAARPLPGAEEQIGDDLWMVPVARDAGGCVQYRLHSSNRATLQAVFYRTPLGAYSTNRAEAGCD